MSLPRRRAPAAAGRSRSLPSPNHDARSLGCTRDYRPLGVTPNSSPAVVGGAIFLTGSDLAAAYRVDGGADRGSQSSRRGRNSVSRGCPRRAPQGFCVWLRAAWRRPPTTPTSLLVTTGSLAGRRLPRRLVIKGAVTPPSRRPLCFSVPGDRDNRVGALTNATAVRPRGVCSTLP
jgi:hypothetical protein